MTKCLCSGGTAPAGVAARSSGGRLTNVVARRFLEACGHIDRGSLCVISPDGQRHWFGGTGGDQVELHIRDWGAITALAARGDIGLGETYIEGLWNCSDIAALTRLALRNEDALGGHLHGSFLNRLSFLFVDRLLRRNSKRGSARNINAHYDVGNEFYRLWLDESMTYSSALFADYGESLEQAQARKYGRLLDATAGAGGRTLEIGCGWGGFAEAAAGQGRDVTAVTISPAQHTYATERLQGCADIQLCDYRDIQGKYDSIVSIEMIEAVGERYWPTYFAKIKQTLSEYGRAALQAIIVNDDLYPLYRRRSDFIRRYTFPGGMLLAPGRIEEEAARAGLKAENMVRFGPDYAETLRRWQTRFEGSAFAIKRLGYSDAFLRSWRFYLAICIGAFDAGRTDVVHVELAHA
jgi:cyclopropane-fatty-acyl-phospholipid synthase